MAQIEIDKEARINELETRLAHQDRSTEKMSDEIYQQQKQIAQLEEKMRWLVERLELVAPPHSSNNQSDEPPPHY